MEEQKQDFFPEEEGRENTKGDIPDISRPAGAEEINPAVPADGMQVHGLGQQYDSCPAGEAAPDQPLNQSVSDQTGQPLPNSQSYSGQPNQPDQQNGGQALQPGCQQSVQPGPGQQFSGQPGRQNGFPEQFDQSGPNQQFSGQQFDQPGPNQQFSGQQYGSQPVWPGPNQQFSGQPPLQNGFPGQYIQPPYGARPPQTQDSGGMAIASMVLGIVSIVLCTLYFLAPVCAIVGLVLGCIYKSKGGKSGLATAGIICSSIGLAIGVIFICVIILGIGLSAYY